jgi:hypothetical protein
MSGRRATGARNDILAGVTRALVDGRNVQFALRRVSGGELPDAALVARLRAALYGLDTTLVLDGHPAGGPQGRIATGFKVEYSRHRDADSVIDDLVAEGARELGPAGADGILVLTDDHAVREHARQHGARVAGTAWLMARIERGVARSAARPGASIGNARPRSSARPPRLDRDR